MFAKLSEVEARFEELNRKLADPDTAQNQRLFRELSKEHADLEKLVFAFRDLKRKQNDLEGSREILESESDPDLLALAREESRELEQAIEKLQQEIKILLLPRDPNDAKNVILEIRGGTGGDEAALFAGDLFRMYNNYAESRGWKVEIMSSSEGSQGGFKEVVALVQGQDVFSGLKFESGVHRVQRVPATESQGRIHTSAVTVAVLPEAEEVDIDIPEKELRIDVYRSSGPGGQSVNTTDSAVRMTHLPTGLVVTCQDEKSQHKNKAKALRILRSRLLDKRQAEEDAKRAAERRSMVKSGDRSEKIRTYNFPQDRLTDHRIGLTVHNLPGVLSGNLESLIDALQTHFQTEQLKGDADSV